MDFLTGKIKYFDENVNTITFEIIRTRQTNQSKYSKIETIKIHKKAHGKKLDRSIINSHILVYVKYKNINGKIIGNYQVNNSIKY